MVGKTSLFTILTGVHQDARIGSTAARTGVAKVPDKRLDALAASSIPPRSPTPPSNTWTCRPFPRRACATPATWPACAWWMPSPTCCACCRTRPFPTRRLGGSPARPGGRGDGADSERSGGDRKAPGAAGQGPQEDQEPGTRPRIRGARNLQGRAGGEPAAAATRFRLRGGEAHPRLPVSFPEAGAVRAQPGRGARRASCTSANGSIARAPWPDAVTPWSPRSAARSKRNWPSCPPRSRPTTWPATA